MKRVIFVFTIILVILFANALHSSYPDEFDNILGGKLILQSILPYRGFFSHHGMLAYFLSAVMVSLAGQSFVHFRLLSAPFFLGLFFLTYLILKRRVNNFSPDYYLVFFLIISVAATYYWGQMFLADPLSGYFLLPAYALLFLKIYLKQELKTADLWVISVSSSLAILNSTTYLYAGFVLVGVTFLTVWQSQMVGVRPFLRSTLRFLLIFSLPYLVFFLYLLLTGSLKDFYFDAVVYNERYYIYNYPRPAGSTSFNPIRYAVVIFNNFVNTYQPLLAGIAGTNFRFPATAMMAVTNAVLWLYLVIRRRWLLLTLAILSIVYVNARGNPGDLRPSDYQSAVYIMLTIFNGVFLLYVLAEELPKIKTGFGRALTTGLGLVFCLFWFFGIVFFVADFWRMNYSRYMGQMPLIYDWPAVAPILNTILSKNDYCWVGPFEFEEMFYSNCQLPSKYHWILPQFAQITEIKQNILTDYSSHQAKIIVFRRNFSAFGQSSDYNSFFVDFLNQNYVRLKDFEPQRKYHFASPKNKDFNFDEDFNLEKSQAPALVARLVEKGYVVKGE